MPTPLLASRLGPLAALCGLVALTACGGSSTPTPTYPSNVTITLTPVAFVQAGTTQQMTATVNGYNSTPVWYLSSTQAVNNGTIGTITTAGLYTAPAAPPLYYYGGGAGRQAFATVIAHADFPCASFLGCSAGGQQSFTITAPSVTAGFITLTGTPAYTVALNGTVKLQPYAVGSTNTAYTLQVNGIPGGSLGSGTIAQDTVNAGLYTAPPAYPITGKVVTITVVSTADPTKSATTTITLL